MQHRFVAVLNSLMADYAYYGLWKLSVNDSCRSHPRSLIFFPLLALLCFSVPQYVVAISAEEIIALSAMRDNWPKLGETFNAWNGDPSAACYPMAWPGIACDEQMENIVAINLRGIGLNGTIPPELGYLPYLQQLYLNINQLSGTIPPKLGDLPFLQKLYLDNNQLSGSIPPELGNLTSLQYLYLDNNQMNGTIPPQLSNLTSVLEIYLNNNHLNGTIPPQLGNFTSLQELYLNNNQLSGTIPPQLANFTSLQELYLNNNQLSGTIPPQLGNSTSLQQIYLRYNQLSGTIPPQLGNFPSLQILVLSYNHLDGTIPPQLGNPTSLRIIYLDNNQLNGTIPPELANLTPLQDLYLNNNQLSGTIPPQLVNLTSLQTLFLSRNRLSGSIPPELGKSTSLDFIYLDHNQLNGPIPPQLGNLTSLNVLSLINNTLSGPFPIELLHSPSLWFLDVRYNELSLCPPPSSTNFTLPQGDTCLLQFQSQHYCDPHCTSFYTSLQCRVNFEVCTFPVTAAGTPFSCASQTPPGPSFSCINGVWTSIGNVSGVTIQVASPTSIEGDLELSNTLTFVGLDGSLSVDGCVNIEGVEIVLSDEDLERIKKSSGKQSFELLKQGKTGCGTLDSIPLSLKHPKSCTKVSAIRDPSSTPSSLAVLFKVNSTNCHLWWIICLSVLGGIVVIALVIVLLVTIQKRQKPMRARSAFK